MHKQNQRQGLLIILTAVLTGAVLVTGAGIYLLLKSVEKPVSTEPSNLETRVSSNSVPNSNVSEAPVDTSIPVAPSPAEKPTTATQPLQARSTIVTSNTRKNYGGANFQGEDLRGKSFRQAQMGGANLANSNLSGVDLSGANMGGANLARANLTNANLNNTDLRGANLSGANLRGANLDGAKTDGANLNGALR
ncbi:hypothetical protein DSM106972_004400 [Dulcicalothrix desertica PCC 7102]|uniref:Pentapeptide repeat-containing protein n=1 Tax=Dulcicalothrix desertica PCC 7102 TaxID=232991 RepID=A0A433VV28_9CYAN|nr:pentapeptide repeat-containing protein [Dulcicalothrix desertica]RUT09945.1 hypothetical protein DSM106972_004400 [Dulcicalothrix desertica PCC 7102]TWH51137.1 putative low-complexity proteins [Dulcicalothrix desertica PCC 7102]